MSQAKTIRLVGVWNLEPIRPVADRSFDRARGEETARGIGFRHDPGVLYRVS